ncbi:MAG: hypothetical protein ACT4P4_28785 [Betaproteobacteria bacterium]
MATRARRTRKTITGFASTRRPRGIIEQAAADLRAGRRDTDCRGAARRIARVRKTA